MFAFPKLGEIFGTISSRICATIKTGKARCLLGAAALLGLQQAACAPGPILPVAGPHDPSACFKSGVVT